MATTNKSGSRQFYLSSAFITGAAIAVTGILFCAFRARLVSVLMTIVGIVIILAGVASLIKRRYAEGAIALVIGAVTIILGWTAVNITLFVLGTVLIGLSVYKIVSALPTLKKLPWQKLLLWLIDPLLTVAIAVLLLVSGWRILDGLFISVGVLGISLGSVMTLSALVGSNASD